MKNYVPLFMAIVLAVAAVLAVDRLLNRYRNEKENTISVVMAGSDLLPGQEIDNRVISRKENVPEQAMPAQAVLWNERSILLGRRTSHAIAKGDYILYSDLISDMNTGSLVGDGQWAVSLSVGSGGIVDLVSPGDEVAILATLNLTVTEKQVGISDTTANKEVTTVLFPKVRVLSIGNSEMNSREQNGNILLSLPPEQAQFLIAAQRNSELALALRRPGDSSNLDRTELGYVDDSSFNDLILKLKQINIPDTSN